MLPQSQPRKRRNSSRVNLTISLVFHTGIVLALVYFAAREGLLGKQMKKIAVQMVKEEKPPEKLKEPEKPKEEPPKEIPKVVQPKVEVPKEVVQAPPAATVEAPPAIAPPAGDVAAFTFEGGKAVQTSSDPVQLYRGLVEYALRSKWRRPPDVQDEFYVAEVEVSIDGEGQITNPKWKKGSGDTRWDDTVRQAIAATTTVNRPPPKNFPARVVVRFDVQEEAEPSIQ
jgi:hypothetical protein